MNENENEIIGSQDDTELITKESKEESVQDRRSYPTQMALTIRAIVGGYVLYLAYGLITSKDAKTPLMYAISVFFVIAGVALIVLSVVHFFRGEYEGGKADEDRSNDDPDV